MSTSNLISSLTTIQKQLILYVCPLWLIFGTVGCLFNLIVFSRRPLRSSSCCIYFFAASVGHLVTLSVGLGSLLHSLNNPDPQTQSLLFCKIRGYLFQISIILSRWFIAFACIDRFASTSMNIRLRNFAKPKIAYRIIPIIILIWSIICIHRLIFYEIKGTLCGIVNNIGAAFYHTAYVIFAVGLFPTITMSTCAYYIRQNLALRQQRRMQLVLGNAHHNSLDQQVLRMLFVQIICYVIFTLPQMGNLIFSTISVTITNRSAEYLAIEKFVLFLAELMLYLFGVTTFYLYTLTSRTFRSELMKLFHCHRHCCKHRIMPAIIDSIINTPVHN
ncbi:hypothetical protein I4U23_003523 [Adineta vaga]|nr:hypothetical protein I4U23_003523 [Adineta vaga]